MGQSPPKFPIIILGLKNFDRIFFKTFDQQFFKHFMCTVYKPFHDECLKNIIRITLISLAIL